jgi:hypothetical protein
VENEQVTLLGQEPIAPGYHPWFQQAGAGCQGRLGTKTLSPGKQSCGTKGASGKSRLSWPRRIDCLGSLGKQACGIYSTQGSYLPWCLARYCRSLFLKGDFYLFTASAQQRDTSPPGEYSNQCFIILEIFTASNSWPNGKVTVNRQEQDH